MIKKLICCCLSILSLTASAQNIDFNRKEVAFSVVAASNFTWEAKLSFSYLFNNYLGVAASISKNNSFEVGSYSPKHQIFSFPRWQVSCSDMNSANTLLRAAIRLSIPPIKLNSDGDVCLSFNVEPGICCYLGSDDVNVLFTRNEGSAVLFSDRSYNPVNTEYFSWNISNQLRLVLDNWFLFTSYNISNIDKYTGKRDVIIEGTRLGSLLPSRELVHGGEIGIGIRF